MKIIVSDQIPEGTILFVPAVTLQRVLNYQTGEIKEWTEFNPKAAGVITNVEMVRPTGFEPVVEPEGVSFTD